MIHTEKEGGREEGGINRERMENDQSNKIKHKAKQNTKRISKNLKWWKFY